MLIFYLKTGLKKNIFLFRFKIEYILIDLNKIFPMKSSGFEITISVKSYDDNTAENYRYCYVAKKRIVFKP